MANEEQLSILKQGVDVWNRWREENPFYQVDLSNASFRIATFISHTDFAAPDTDPEIEYEDGRRLGMDFRGINLSNASLIGTDFYNADLSDANLSKAILGRANLGRCNLNKASLRGAYLVDADLTLATLKEADCTNANLWGVRLLDANLSNANLQGADLIFVNFLRANLSGANLEGANLNGAMLVETRIDKTKISGSSVYGISTWDLVGEFEEQKDLVVSRKADPRITVDNVEVAQFIYLILNNEKIRGVINTLTSKSVLILGRFTPERKAVLDALRNKLREYDLLPILFDFDKPTDKDFTETVKTLAGISYFVIADVTNPKSSPLELQATVPDYQIPFVPIIQEGESPFAMMVDLQKKYNWVLPTRSYDSIDTLMKALKPGIIDPAVEMRNKLRQIKAQEHPVESLKDYLDKSL
jgi:uncharacterized protein YjbI with pentapeptide repeats